MVHYRPKNKFCLQELGRALSLFQTQRNLYTEKLLHKKPFHQKNISYIEKLYFFSQREGSAHRGFYTRKLSHPQWQQEICIPKTGSRRQKQKNVFFFFFFLPHFTKNFQKGKSSAPMEKKNLFMQPRQILLWNFDATIPLRSAFIFSRVFFLLVAKRRAYLGGMRLGESCCPPIHQQRPTQKGMEGALKRQPWRSRGGPWNTPTRSSGPVTAAATLLHLPPQPPTTMGSCFDLEIDVVVSTRWCNIFPNAQLGSALDSLKCTELSPNEQLILNVFNHSSW